MAREVSAEHQTGSALTMPTEVGRNRPRLPRHGHEPATLLGQRYELDRRIAIGGMGEVWAATDTVLGRQVAVKILRDEFVDSPVALARFRAEARHTAALTHHGIAGVFDYGEDDCDGKHVAFLVMELVHGRPLSKVIAESGPLPTATALSYLAQAADALQVAHDAGVVHRDVKPGNVLVLDDGTIKLTDFGIARAAGSAALTEAGQVVGTASYIAPEQAMGAEATATSDVYSLGVVGYEMLAGHPPFTADNALALSMAHVNQSPPPLPDSVPADVRGAITTAMSKSPADRPADAAAFAAELRRLQAIADDTLVADIGEPTIVMSDDAPARTATMPASHVVRPLDLGVAAEAHSARRQRRWIAVAVLVAVALFVLAQLSGTHVAIPANGLTTTSNSVQTLVEVDPRALIGHPFAQVTEALTKVGLQVTTTRVAALGVPADIVTAVNPNGKVPAGSTVELTVSSGPPPATTTPAAAPAPAAKKDHGKGKGHGDG